MHRLRAATRLARDAAALLQALPWHWRLLGAPHCLAAVVREFLDPMTEAADG